MLIASLPISSESHVLDFHSSVSFFTSVPATGTERMQGEHWGALANDGSNLGSKGSSLLIQHETLLTAFPLFDLTKKLQRLGENVFTAALLVAVLQAAVALYQYRSNPKGELIVPPGLTWGVENPTDARIDQNSYAERDDPLNMTTVSMQDSQTAALADVNREDDATDSSLQNMWTRPLSKLNRWLFLLMPWMARQVSSIMQRNSHLFHIGFIMSLASLFGIRRPKFQTGNTQEEAPAWTVDLHENKDGQESQRVIIIGDSLAVGLGCSNTFDTNKNSTMPMMRLENVSRYPNETVGKAAGDKDGPAFPKVLARTLSHRLQCRVFWRSAGVDGGSVEDIEKYCLGVVEEETERGRPPDVVVILCGMNDLKTFVGNPFQSSSSVAFQGKLFTLIRDIRRYAPDCKIVLPALPIQMFHRHSLLNILPLALFLDAIVGFWDSQKKRVADMAPSYALYVGLSAADIYDWYTKGDREDTRLIAADGIHPNRRCYSYWAEVVGNKLADKLGASK